MKKKIIALTLALSFAVAAPASATPDFSSIVPEDMEKDELVDAYNELRDYYNALYELYLDELAGGGSGGQTAARETEDEDEAPLVTVSLANKTTSTGKYSEHYANFVFDIKNDYDKDIKGIQGVATFKDLFGVKIIAMNADFTGKEITNGMTTEISTLRFECNRFDDEDMKLFNTGYSDLQFEYKVTMIVFDDGTSLEF